MKGVRRLTRLFVTACVATGVVAGAFTHEVAAAGPAPSAVAPSGLVYTVVKGDSLSGIAGKVHVRLADLLALNQLTTTSLILPGMELLVPAGGSLPGSNTAPPAVYTVVRGDTFVRIAGRLQVTHADQLATRHVGHQPVEQKQVVNQTLGAGSCQARQRIQPAR